MTIGRTHALIRASKAHIVDQQAHPDSAIRGLDQALSENTTGFVVFPERASAEVDAL